MPQQKKRSEPRLFQCTGFGNCNMVFTRSEHLARHARKHTGEKPYKCIVPECDRRFSRFDNMMQHTHTHNRIKKKESNFTPIELSMPIHELLTSNSMKNTNNNMIYITVDEFEALQGFSQFYNNCSSNFRLN